MAKIQIQNWCNNIIAILKSLFWFTLLDVHDDDISIFPVPPIFCSNSRPSSNICNVQKAYGSFLYANIERGNGSNTSFWNITFVCAVGNVMPYICRTHNMEKRFYYNTSSCIIVLIHFLLNINIEIKVFLNVCTMYVFSWNKYNENKNKL